MSTEHYGNASFHSSGHNDGDGSDHDYRDENGGGKQEEQQEVIAKQETRVVLWIRVVVCAVLVVTTLAVAYLVHRYIETSQQQDFETSFDDNAVKVFEAIGNALDVSLGAVDAFALGLVSFARYANKTWPFVALPDFGVRSAKLRALSKSVHLGFYPIVATEQLREWEAFAAANNAWVNETIQVQAHDETFPGDIIYDWEPLDFVHGSTGPVTYEGPYVPQWQSAPAVPKFPYFPYNWDLMFLDYSRRAIEEVMNSQTVVFQKTFGVVSFPPIMTKKGFWNLKTHSYL